MEPVSALEPAADPKCNALSLADSKPCESVATINGIF